MIEKTICVDENIHVKAYKKDGLWIIKGFKDMFAMKILLSYDEWDEIVEFVKGARLSQRTEGDSK